MDKYFGIVASDIKSDYPCAKSYYTGDKIKISKKQYNDCKQGLNNMIISVCIGYMESGGFDNKLTPVYKECKISKIIKESYVLSDVEEICLK